jgi:hypothetical protein
MHHQLLLPAVAVQAAASPAVRSTHRHCSLLLCQCHSPARGLGSASVICQQQQGRMDETIKYSTVEYNTIPTGLKLASGTKPAS